MGKIMAQSSTKVLFILLVTFAITIPCLEAGIAKYDDFLKAEAEEAHKIALETYIPIHEHHSPHGHHHPHVHSHLKNEKKEKN
ncbi:unnamed protein product [Trifolium pratense]|uniref:Uncharacterized protein n=1 Tax=Trifolium pratense TaxID=57577 RepID=A0ACB0LAN9_TRIPR|nr:unnamed protein product [Trifolium pratense]